MHMIQIVNLDIVLYVYVYNHLVINIVYRV